MNWERNDRGVWIARPAENTLLTVASSASGERWEWTASHFSRDGDLRPRGSCVDLGEAKATALKALGHIEALRALEREGS